MPFIIVLPWFFKKLFKGKYRGMAFFPFVFLRYKSDKLDPIIMNHEKIHFYQQLELGVIFFYIIYIAHYLINRAKGYHHDKAYHNIVFEKEAYAYEKNLQYNKKRKLWAWLRFT